MLYAALKEIRQVWDDNVVSHAEEQGMPFREMS